MNRWVALILFIVVTEGGGFLIGLIGIPDEWYRALVKPSFNPPDWLFGAAWSVLYLLVGVAGWLVWQNANRAAQTLWWIQLAINFCWSPTFFRLHQIGLALAIVLAMFVAILAFIAVAWRRERAAALLFVPYAFWTAFAALLNASILALN